MTEAQSSHEGFHLVEPSPWPIVGAFFAFLTALGLIQWMKAISIAGMRPGGWVLTLGVAGLLFTFAGWQRDVVVESHEGHHNDRVSRGLSAGMLLFIASEVMFFVAWFWAYFNSSLFTADTAQYGREAFTGGLWPPKGIVAIDPWRLPLINTAILVSSSGVVTMAHEALNKNNRAAFMRYLALTVVMGFLFVAIQAYEYAHAPFAFANSIYGSTFFMATGFHGAHVIIGAIFLSVCLFRAIGGGFTPRQHLGFLFAEWYWHFVDVVWIFLFSCIYIWGTWGATME